MLKIKLLLTVGAALLYLNLAIAQRISEIKISPKELKHKLRECDFTSIEKKIKAYSFTSSRGFKMPYGLYKPKFVAGKIPLVIYLHGIADKTNGKTFQPLMHKQVLAFIHPEKMRHQLCYFLAPQINEREHWGTRNVNQAADSLATLQELVVKLKADKSLKIDPRRIYLVGISSGGWGTFDAISIYPDTFAAAVVVSSSPALGLARKRKRINPVWLSCNSNDANIYRKCRKLAQVLQKRGVKVKLAVANKRSGHNAWQWAYYYRRTHDWLFQQKLKINYNKKRKKRKTRRKKRSRNSFY